MGEALARFVAILDRREQGAEEQHQTIGIAVMGVDRLCGQIGRVPADLTHGRAAVHDEAILPRHGQGDFQLAHSV
ncbi:hypothetical protein D3C85_1592060 [compost metagenome]